MSRKHRHSKGLPENRGSATAAELEQNRARAIYAQRARDAKKGFDEVNKPIDIAENNKPKASRNHGKKLHPEAKRRLLAKRDAFCVDNEKAYQLLADAIGVFASSIQAFDWDTMRGYAPEASRKACEVEHRFSPHWRRLLHLFVGIEGEVVTQNVTVDKQPTAVENVVTTRAIQKSESAGGIDIVSLITTLDDRAAKREERNQDRLLQALATIIGARGGDTQRPALTEAPPIVSEREPSKEEPPAQVEIPATVEALRPVPVRVLINHPRLARQPNPNDVEDGQLFNVLRNMIDVYGEITRQFDEGYLLVYDEINRTFDPELKKKKHGERIQYIGSQGTKYKRQALEAAFRMLVKPFVKAA